MVWRNQKKNGFTQRSEYTNTLQLESTGPYLLLSFWRHDQSGICLRWYHLPGLKLQKRSYFCLSYWCLHSPHTPDQLQPLPHCPRHRPPVSLSFLDLHSPSTSNWQHQTGNPLARTLGKCSLQTPSFSLQARVSSPLEGVLELLILRILPLCSHFSFQPLW